MSILDIQCNNSVSFSKHCHDMKACCACLFLGGCHDYKICLSFAYPPCTWTTKPEKATLILFKIPMNQTKTRLCACHDGCSPVYSAYPLLEFFSTYSNLYSLPKVDQNNEIKFENHDNLCYTEIDITDIFNEWNSNNLENRGLMLTGSGSRNIIHYASEKNDDTNMCPILRLVYKNNPYCQELSSIPCIVKVT